MKTFANAKDCSRSHIIISAPASLFVIGGFSWVSTPYWMQEKSAEMYESQAASGSDISKLQVGSCKLLHGQNRSFSASVGGYWKEL